MSTLTNNKKEKFLLRLLSRENTQFSATIFFYKKKYNLLYFYA